MAKRVNSARRSTLPSTDERLGAGRDLRDKGGRGRHDEWKARDDRADPVELLRESDQHRLPELLPIRYGRMSSSPFNFLRGAAAVMAADLARAPDTGLRV